MRRAIAGRWRKLPLLAMLWLAAALRISEAATSVTFLDLPDPERPPEFRQGWDAFRDVIEARLSQVADLQVVERARIRKIEQELELQLLGRSSEDRALLQGGFLGAELLIVPVATRGTNRVPQVKLRIISTRLAEQLSEVPVNSPLPPAEEFCEAVLGKALREAQAKLTKLRQEKTVAVLFLTNETGEGRFRYLGPKLELALRAALSQTSGLHALQRTEVGAARPETVLAATGWVSPSARWQAQHADVLVYGSYTVEADARVPVTESPVTVQYTIFSRANGGVVRGQTGWMPGEQAEQWRTIADAVRQQVDAARTPANSATVSARVEAEKLFAEAQRVLAMGESSGSDRQKPSGVEFYQDANVRAVDYFLTASFLAPDWEAPLREAIRHASWHPNEVSEETRTAVLHEHLMLGEEYFARFGGLETENGRQMCQILALRASILYSKATWNELPLPDREALFRRLKAIVATDFRQQIRPPGTGALGVMSNMWGLWGRDPWLFELFHETRRDWLRIRDPLVGLKYYSLSARSADQKDRACGVILEWFQVNHKNQPRTYTAEERVLLREMLARVGLDATRWDEVSRLTGGQVTAAREVGSAPREFPQFQWNKPATFRIVKLADLSAFRERIWAMVRSNAQVTVLEEMRAFQKTHTRPEAFQTFAAVFGGNWGWGRAADAVEGLALLADLAVPGEGEPPFADFFAGADSRRWTLIHLSHWLCFAPDSQRRFTTRELSLIQRAYEVLGEPVLGRLQVERLRLGKRPWYWDPSSPQFYRNQNVVHFPAGQLVIPKLSVPVEDLKVWTTESLAAESGRLLVCATTIEGGPAIGHYLLEYDETAKQWRNLSQLCGAKHTTLVSLLTVGRQVYAGTAGEGLWVFDPEKRQARLLTAENGLPSLYVRSLGAINGEVWLAGGYDETFVARLKPETGKVYLLYTNQNHIASPVTLPAGATTGLVMNSNQGELFLHDASAKATAALRQFPYAQHRQSTRGHSHAPFVTPTPPC